MQQAGDVRLAGDLLAEFPAERGFEALILGVEVAAWQHPVCGTVRPVPADRQQAAIGSDRHGADALDHPSSQIVVSAAASLSGLAVRNDAAGLTTKATSQGLP